MFRRIKINNRTRIGGTTVVMPSEPIRKSPTGCRAFFTYKSTIFMKIPPNEMSFFLIGYTYLIFTLEINKWLQYQIVLNT